MKKYYKETEENRTCFYMLTETAETLEIVKFLPNTNTGRSLRRLFTNRNYVTTSFNPADELTEYQFFQSLKSESIPADDVFDLLSNLVG